MGRDEERKLRVGRSTKVKAIRRREANYCTYIKIVRIDARVTSLLERWIRSGWQHVQITTPNKCCAVNLVT